jgi:rRNA maturation protein Rpf1
LAVKKINPAEFYESPDQLDRRLNITREKEGFVIVEVVQNQPGTMNFYRVRFDTDQTGYLSADGNYLELKIKEGSLIPVPRRGSGQKKGSSQSKMLALQAVERVRNHLTLPDPATGEKRSVEKRMMDQKTRSFPSLTWRYEVKEVGTHRYRVVQYAGEGAGPPLIRTWIVDMSTNEIRPENMAAKEMYRPFD